MNKDEKKLYTSTPSLPSLDELTGMLKTIWSNRMLTNTGPYHQALEDALCSHLGVEHISLYANGTLALLAALKLLDIQGEVITTPYSFVATANALIWQHLKPVFVDIDPETFNLHPDNIHAAITPDTRAILPVHCYGIPCAVDEIAAIAKQHQLRVIYDAAHAFGVNDEQGKSILTYGDLSIVSFHATKLFSTCEGGAIICPDAETKMRADRFKNFGISSETSVEEVGFNAKLSEIHAAFGLLQLKRVDEEISYRRNIAQSYIDGLAGVHGLTLPNAQYFKFSNFSYFPILVHSSLTNRDKLYAFLQKHHIYAKRYFYPLISQFKPYFHMPSSAPDRLPIAHQYAQSVLCLPIHSAMTAVDINKIISTIQSAMNTSSYCI